MAMHSGSMVIIVYLVGMHFLKEQLNRNNNYSWPDEPTFTGDPSRRLFNRYNGNQMLFLINHYASLTEGFTVNNGVHVEDILINQLPLEAKSEISVLKWLKENES